MPQWEEEAARRQSLSCGEVEDKERRRLGFNWTPQAAYSPDQLLVKLQQGTGKAGTCGGTDRVQAPLGRAAWQGTFSPEVGNVLNFPWSTKEQKHSAWAAAAWIGAWGQQLALSSEVLHFVCQALWTLQEAAGVWPKMCSRSAFPQHPLCLPIVKHEWNTGVNA